MIDIEFEKIENFSSLKEYKRFLIWLEKHKQNSLLEEVPVDKHKRFKWSSTNERWFRICGKEEKWRLVEPDFPFKGVFEEIE